MDYIEAAIKQGYSPDDYTTEVLEAIGMAIERAHCDWSYYRENVKGSHYNAVVETFSYSECEPSLEGLVGAYAEGMAA